MSVFSLFACYHVVQKRIKEYECSGAIIPGLPHTATICIQHLAGVFITTSSPAHPLSLRNIQASSSFSSSQALLWLGMSRCWCPAHSWPAGWCQPCNIQEEVRGYSTYLLHLMEKWPVVFKWASRAVLHILWLMVNFKHEGNCWSWRPRTITGSDIRPFPLTLCGGPILWRSFPNQTAQMRWKLMGRLSGFRSDVIHMAVLNAVAGSEQRGMNHAGVKLSPPGLRRVN